MKGDAIHISSGDQLPDTEGRCESVEKHMAREPRTRQKARAAERCVCIPGSGAADLYRKVPCMISEPSAQRHTRPRSDKACQCWHTRTGRHSGTFSDTRLPATHTIALVIREVSLLDIVSLGCDLGDPWFAG
jgi:hypothetical protein